MNFNEQVFALVKRIPEGKVLNYGAVAKILGKPRAARAVGYAIYAAEADIPWYRVVGKDGIYGKSTIPNTHFAAAEQVARLKDEGIVFDAENRFILSDYLWEPDEEVTSPEC